MVRPVPLSVIAPPMVSGVALFKYTVAELLNATFPAVRFKRPLPPTTRLPLRLTTLLVRASGPPLVLAIVPPERLKAPLPSDWEAEKFNTPPATATEVTFAARLWRPFRRFHKRPVPKAEVPVALSDPR